MDIRHMRQLLAIREQGSLAKAAKALNVSQPSLSKGITRLEDELKVRLFDRTAHGSELTPIGELIANRAERVLAEMDGLRRDAALAAGGATGFVRLGVGTSLIYDFLPRLTLKIADSHPDLDVHFEINERERLIGSLQARELDVVFGAVGDEVEGAVVVAHEIFRSRRIVAAVPDHPLVGRERIPVSELADYRSAGSATLQLRDGAISGFGATLVGLERPYTSNFFEALLPLAVAGKTIMIAPAFVLRPHIAAGALVQLDVDWDFELSFSATTMRAASFSPILNTIVRYASEIGRSLDQDWRRGEGDMDPIALMKAENLKRLVAGRAS